MRYILQFETMTIGTPWQHEFSVPNDAMALDYAKRTMENDLAARAGALALLLWRAPSDDDEPIPDHELLARFVLDKPTARNTQVKS